MSRRMISRLLGLAALMAVVPLSMALEARAPRTPEGGEAPLVLPRADVLRPLLLGFQPLAADLYWLRTIQYFGGHIQTDNRYPQLPALVDLVTNLDPRFVEAYQLGGLFLIVGRQLPEAIAVYEKGIAANPGRWELPYDLGRLYFLELHDNAAALRWWEVADGLPGRPEYIHRFIARLHAKIGDLETAFELWQAMYENTNNEWVRKTAKQEMEKLLARMRVERPRDEPSRRERQP